MSAAPFASAQALVKVKCLHCLQSSHSFRPMVEQAGSSAKRIRIGLTGLAFAFVFVLLGSAITQSGEDGVVNTVEQKAEAAPSEPLAELGIAPGASEDANSNNAVEP